MPPDGPSLAPDPGGVPRPAAARRRRRWLSAALVSAIALALLMVVVVAMSLGRRGASAPGPSGTATTAASSAPSFDGSALPAPTAFPVPRTASALYVATDGSDANPGTQAAPFATVAHGLALLRPGQTLYLRGGTYVEDITARLPAGSAEEPIVVSSYPGERAVIKGLVELDDPTYVTLNGFNVTWNHGEYDQHMLKIVGGREWTLQNSEIWGARSFADLLIAGSPQGWTVRGNVIHDTYGGEANVNRSHNVYANTNLDATGGLIERNVLFNAGHGTNLKLAGSGGPGGGAANVIVRYNTLYSATQPLLLGDGSHHVIIERNIIGGSARGNLVRLFQLVGTGNVIRDNLGFGASTFCDDFDSTVRCAAVVAGSVFPRDPRFDSTAVGGFHPSDAVARAYGRFAP